MVRLVLIILLVWISPELLDAGTFFADFDSGLPANTAVFGSATVGRTGGWNNSGSLHLTVAEPDQTGSFVINPLDGPKAVSSFVASFKAYIGAGNGADGFGFCLAPGNLKGSFGEICVRAGLTVIFDTHKFGNETAPAILIASNKVVVATQPVSDLRKQRFVDVFVKLDSDGTLDVFYDRVLLVANKRVWLTNIAGSFGFGARTGSLVDNHFIDEINITTQTSPGPFVETFSPFDTNASPMPLIEIALRDFNTRTDPGSIQLSLDGTRVIHTLLTNKSDTIVQYQPPDFLEPGSLHAVTIVFGDIGNLVTNSFSYDFIVGWQVMTPPRKQSSKK